MLKSQYLVLCISFVVGSYGSIVPFINKCGQEDNACIVKSSQAAIEPFSKGLPDLGVPPLDPMKIDKATYNEGGLKVEFKDMIVTGASKCKVVKAERNLAKNLLIFAVEAPIHVHGTYVASGTLITAPVEGDGPFEVHTNNIYILVKIVVTTVDGPDGQNHWKIGKYEYEFDVKEKAHMKFENLFGGDQAQAAPILQILDASWKELITSVGKPIVNKVIKHILKAIKIFADNVPASDLELY